VTRRCQQFKFVRCFFALGAAMSIVVACDTGDGTRLKAPTQATTLPPPETTPLPSVPLDSVPISAPVFDTLAGDPLTPPDPSGAGFRVFAPWAEEGPIDSRYTCDNNSAPPITWSEVPEGTVELAISLVDDTELNNGRPFIHWVIAGLDPGIGRLDEATVPPGAVQALNFFGDVGYGGPCPNPGDTHTYRLTLYALGQQAEVVDGAPGAEFLDTIDAIAIGSTSTLATATR
jgi:Raf kinase inhibitor-like YbhB/YbcL family protein